MSDISILLQNTVWQYYLSALIMLWPMARIFKRAGFAVWGAGCLVIPLVGPVLCAGLLTFRRWPARPKTGAK